VISGVSSVVLDDFLSQVSDLLQFLSGRQLVINVLLKISQLLPSVSHFNDIVNKLSVVFSFIHVVGGVKITVLESSY
jgi:hypothetical protein